MLNGTQMTTDEMMTRMMPKINTENLLKFYECLKNYGVNLIRFQNKQNLMKFFYETPKSNRQYTSSYVVRKSPKLVNTHELLEVIFHLKYRSSLRE